MTPAEQKAIVRAGYDRLSYAYRADETPDDHGPYAAWVQLLAGLLPAQAPVLDIGCGCGLPATRLLAQRFQVTGVDLSEVQISRARHLVPAARFLCGDIASQSFDPGSFGAVVSFYAIIHMPITEHAALFRQVARWLRPGGYLLAIVGHDAWTGSEASYLGVAGGRMCWSHADEATNLVWIQQAGLQVRWSVYVPDGESGHALVLAQKPPVAAPPAP